MESGACIIQREEVDIYFFLVPYTISYNYMDGLKWLLNIYERVCDLLLDYFRPLRDTR
jgi:hypothetical protein